MHFQVCVTEIPAASPWQNGALLSFTSSGANIHINAVDDLRTVQKAARKLSELNIESFQLTGEWQAEQQWAFAKAATSTKQERHIVWCDDENKTALEQSYIAMLFARKLSNSSPEELAPVDLARQAADWLQQLAPEAISAKFIEGEALAEQGWVGVYQVGRGSQRPPVMLEIDYNPSFIASDKVSTALVGKGITFDSGGYSIKASQSMLGMKQDMGGAATVTAALGLAIMQGLNKRVKLYLCCAENLISGHAYKLGDILQYKNGVSVEVVNTDAEGRLVLADGLIAASENQPDLIVDAATLTGAAHVAVGSDYNAIFTMDKALQQQVLDIAEQEHEPTWPLPIQPWHQEMCPSAYADTANSKPQKGGGAGAASNAAGFLSRFVALDNGHWVHFDLAAAFNENATSTMPAGATGQGIRTIASLLLRDQ